MDHKIFYRNFVVSIILNQNLDLKLMVHLKLMKMEYNYFLKQEHKQKV